MKNSISIWVIIILIGMGACKKPPSTNIQPENNASKNNPLDTFTVREIDFKFLTAKAKVRFKDVDNDISATAHFRIQKDSLIWISIVPTLGIEASRCLINKDSIFFLDRINNNYYVFNFKELGQKINIHLTYNILQSMLLGSLPFPKQNSDILSKSVNNEYFILKQFVEDMQIENFVKVNSMKLEKFDIKEEKTNKDLQVVYSNFLPLNNFFFPFNYQISVTYPMNKNLQHTSISVEYQKVELPDKELNFPFNVPNKFLRK
ncbi:MAG: DUF4292 domain-containing protein [Cytophagales bacterium]|nr:MAG: DUF4292 domain-containing protein [Cytophagales bacterium]